MKSSSSNQFQFRNWFAHYFFNSTQKNILKRLLVTIDRYLRIEGANDFDALCFQSMEIVAIVLSPRWNL